MSKENLEDFVLLIVDDNPENLNLLARLFKTENYRIEYANNGEEALDIIGKTKIDIILLDINMPEMDGFDVCKKIRSQADKNNIPIIFLTAMAERESIIKGFEIGAQDYVTKPFEPKELRARVKTQLALKSNIEKLAELNHLLEEKVLERTSQLSKALDKAEESDRLKSAFLANISHEIRTPMNGILGFVELLKRPGLTDEKQKYYFDVITESGKRMLNIINNIVDLSKIESGLINIQTQKTQLNKVLKYLYDFFKPEAEKKGLELYYHCGISHEEYTIETDQELLVRVLTNIIENAIKFTISGSVNFGYQCIEDYLQFYVSDTGIGIPPDKKSLIFDRFVQADISLIREYEGAGLGLSISKAYIELLNGKIWVESELGRGSKFYFLIPLNPSNNYQTETNIISRLHNKLKPLNILIAEDDLYSIQYMKEIFGEEKVNLFFASNGQKAIDIINEIPEIDLVLMDIKMPVMDGYEATKKIKKLKPYLPIIAQTAHAMSADDEKSRLAGCDNYITKPINENQLFEMINKYITY